MIHLQIILFAEPVVRTAALVWESLMNEEAFERMAHVPGFWSLFGLVACTLIIVFSKWFGHAGIMKPEDYYDDE